MRKTSALLLAALISVSSAYAQGRGGQPSQAPPAAADSTPRVETAGEKETELADLEAALAPLPIDGFTSGALASEYQRTRLEGIGHRLGLKSFAPLWHNHSSASPFEMLPSTV